MFCGMYFFQVTQKSLRKVIGVVPQDTVLFNNNIRYKMKTVSFDQLLYRGIRLTPRAVSQSARTSQTVNTAWVMDQFIRSKTEQHSMLNAARLRVIVSAYSGKTLLLYQQQRHSENLSLLLRQQFYFFIFYETKKRVISRNLDMT